MRAQRTNNCVVSIWCLRRELQGGKGETVDRESEIGEKVRIGGRVEMLKGGDVLSREALGVGDDLWLVLSRPARSLNTRTLSNKTLSSTTLYRAKRIKIYIIYHTHAVGQGRTVGAEQSEGRG